MLIGIFAMLLMSFHQHGISGAPPQKQMPKLRAFVEINDAWGIINEKGQLVVKPQYSEVQPFSEGLVREITW